MLRRRPVLVAPLAMVGVLGLIAACDTGDGRELRPPTSEQRVQATNAASTTTTTIAPASVVETGAPASGPTTSLAAPTAFLLTAPWDDGEPIPQRFTCDGRDLSPTLTWTAPPPGTVELALVMSDDDANFVHWIVVGMAPAAGVLVEGEVPEGLLQIVNDFGDAAWGGPCPPAGPAHTYRFQLFALREPAQVAPDAGADAVVASIEANQQGVAVVTGTYARA